MIELEAVSMLHEFHGSMIRPVALQDVSIDATCGRKYDKITGGTAIEQRVTRKSRFIAIRVATIRHVSTKNLFCDKGLSSNAIKHGRCVHCNEANGQIYGHFAPRLRALPITGVSSTFKLL